MSVISDAFHTIVNEIKSIAVDIFTAFLDAGKQLIKDSGPILITAATAAVQAAEAAGGSGSDKFNAAVAAVVSTLESQGLPVVENAVRLAVEAAVANLNSSAPAAPAAAPAPAAVPAG